MPPIRKQSGRVNPSFPGHHYLGPGNSLDTAPPVDRDDAIAQDHDRAYANAHNALDIFEADHEAIAEFNRDWQDTYNVHSLIGAVGLSSKNFVEEHVLGFPLYPSVSGNYAPS